MPNANKGKHTVFDSDDEGNSDRENTTTQKVSLFDEDSDEVDGSGSEEKQDLRNTKVRESNACLILFQQFLVVLTDYHYRFVIPLLPVSVCIVQESNKAGGSKLFDSSEDEDDGTEKDRFKIKPQFEGKAGQKVTLFTFIIFQMITYCTVSYM